VAPTVAYLTGTWPDGTIPPAPSSAFISFAAGTDAAVQLSVRSGSGAVKDLTGYTVSLFVGWSSAAIPAVVATPSTGVCLFTFDGAATDGITPGRYSCQFEATDADGIREMLTPVGSLTLLGTLG
jgi:hypothetical protein